MSSGSGPESCGAGSVDSADFTLRMRVSLLAGAGVIQISNRSISAQLLHAVFPVRNYPS